MDKNLELPDPFCHNFRFADIINHVFVSYEQVGRSE